MILHILHLLRIEKIPHRYKTAYVVAVMAGEGQE